MLGDMNDFLRTFLGLLFNVLYVALIGRILLSFIDPQGGMRVTQILSEITEPILGPIRRILPTIGFIDLSPMVAFFIIGVLQQLTRQL
jgi:YggT family protein